MDLDFPDVVTSSSNQPKAKSTTKVQGAPVFPASSSVNGASNHSTASSHCKKEQKLTFSGTKTSSPTKNSSSHSAGGESNLIRSSKRENKYVYEN